MRSHLDDAKALRLAKPYRMSDGKPATPDPFPLIPCALLSADHISQYAFRTGMIAPFDGRVYEKCPLKAASYEGKIGKSAYIFEKGDTYPTKVFHGNEEFLKVPANSIVFVESDLNFRLPSFIAVRFNLQIKHVHRGLLLGTGPLVDPCFWGKLCIPLHNLTNEDYFIPKEEGLIWVEFTKTSSSPTLGRPPSNTNLDDIKKAIEDAARQLRPDFQPIAIRSSIPDMVSEAENRSKEAAIAASRSEISSKKSLKITESLRNWSYVGLVIGAASVFGMAATIIGTSWGYYHDTMNDISQLKKASEQAEKAINQHIADIDNFKQMPAESTATASELRSKVQVQSNEIEKLNSELLKLRSEVEHLKPKPCDLNRPDIKCP